METVLVYYNRKIQRERVRKGRIKIRNRRDWDLEMKNKDTERDLIIIRLWFGHSCGQSYKATEIVYYDSRV